MKYYVLNVAISGKYGIITFIIGTGRSCLDTLYNAQANATLASNTFGRTMLVRENYIGTCSKFLPLLLAAINIASSAVCYR